MLQSNDSPIGRCLSFLFFRFFFSIVYLWLSFVLHILRAQHCFGLTILNTSIEEFCVFFVHVKTRAASTTTIYVIEPKPMCVSSTSSFSFSCFFLLHFFLSSRNETISQPFWLKSKNTPKNRKQMKFKNLLTGYHNQLNSMERYFITKKWQTHDEREREREFQEKENIKAKNYSTQYQHQHQHENELN